MTKFRKRLSRHTAKLLFLVWFIIPFAPIALLWNWLNPVGFCQLLIMLLMCCFLYVGFLVAVFIVALVVIK